MSDSAFPILMKNNKRKIIFILIISLIVFILAGTYFYPLLKSTQQQSAVFQQSIDVTKKFNNFPITQTNQEEINTFSCVVSKLIPGKIPLEGEYFAVFSVECEYFDAGNTKRKILIPIAIANEQEIITHGFDKNLYHPDYETAHEAFWLSQLGAIGFKGIGHILSPNIEQADPALGNYGSFQGFGAEVMKDYYSLQNLQEFAQTGDPKYLNGILWTTDIGIVNTLNNIEKDKLQDIAPGI